MTKLLPIATLPFTLARNSRNLFHANSSTGIPLDVNISATNSGFLLNVLNFGKAMLE